jgi:hypothetical protein
MLALIKKLKVSSPERATHLIDNENAALLIHGKRD